MHIYRSHARFVIHRGLRHLFQGRYDILATKEKQIQAQGEKMESGSAVVGKEERKKYQIYVEEYVLSYLRRESDSLELSEIYFYGSRQEGGRKLYVYGAGRDRGIAAFSGYEPLSELVCRLTQAGPVFLVREPDGECRATGFQVFYDNNEAMQNYLLEWTGSSGKRRIAEQSDGQEISPVPVVIPKEEKKRAPHGAMSVQLCLILVVLVAIVITSTDSYDKMKELNRSAKEVFFAIENQEAEEPDKDVREREIVVERDTGVSGQTEQDSGAEMEQAKDADFDGAADSQARSTASDASESGTEGSTEKGQQEEGVLKSVQETSDETGGQAPAEDREESRRKESALVAQGEEEKEDKTEEAEQSEEDNEEALSRSVTRYYEVEQGDTLYTISQKIYGDISRVEKICEANDISDPDKIRSGQRIILP